MEKHSLWHYTNHPKTEKLRALVFTYIFIPILMFSSLSVAQQLHGLTPQELIERQYIDPDHAAFFATLQVQDFQGRIKPIHTLALELLRKTHGKNSFSYSNDNNEKQKLSPVQVFLGMQFKPDSWQLLEYIKINKKVIHTLEKELKINQNGYTSPSQFFDFSGNYKIKPFVDRAYGKAPGKRTTFDKEIIKIDERINISLGIFGGHFLRIFPKNNDPDNRWYSTANKEVLFEQEDAILFRNFSKKYFNQLQESIEQQNWFDANETIQLVKGFQQQKAKSHLISISKVNWEIWYNDHPIFLFCLIGYSLLGIILLIFAFIDIFIQEKTKHLRWINNTLLLLLFILFCYQGFGLVLRWYISGHAPWTNGYEASIFISWITLLAGLFFSKADLFTAAVSCIIATCLLGIAHGSLMNPEITNLVPVLKSYWLLIHVAVITGSYGFLGLGSLLSFITLTLLSLGSIHSIRKDAINASIQRLTDINQLTATIGLFMLTIGTFLGGIWANESWGRYWGWDPKETWALISIIIYSFVLHIRIIFPKNYIYIYSVCSLFAIASILMTFFGVNYYLSGLHSYAKGDAFPIPNWIFVILIVFITISLLPYLIKRHKKPVTIKL